MLRMRSCICSSHSCRGSSRLSSRVPTLLQGVLNVVLQHCPSIERHWCSDRPSAAGSFVWVAVEVTAVGVSQSHKEIPRLAGSPVWTGMERVAMAANLVAFCCSTQPLGRTELLSSEPADACCTLPLSLRGPSPTAALLLVVLQFEILWQICRPQARGSATVMPSHQCSGFGVLPRWTAEGEEGRKVLREMGLWKSSKVRWSGT